MKLVPVNPADAHHAQALYALLGERDPEAFVSHETMPGIDEHRRFILSAPFLWWYLIDVGAFIVGAIEATDRNELGITIFKRYQRQGYGSRALRLFIDTHQPLAAIPAVRNSHWLANIAMGNRDSKRFFQTMGFNPIQETWRHG